MKELSYKRNSTRSRLSTYQLTNLSTSAKEFGKWGEDRAVQFLEGQGFRILARSFRTKLGEVDIVAQEGSTLVFVEVKSRSSDSFAPAELAVNLKKQKKMTQVALWYLKQRRVRPDSIRFDVMTIYPEVPPT
ncbi:MAG: YraN family protein, partial [Elusimicrobia bacterium]|nr:YraN family protein [Elusimicrobiota bacterium]